MLVLLIVVRFDVQVAVEQQPPILRQLVSVGEVQVNYRLLHLLDHVELFTVALHLVDVLRHVHHGLLCPLQPAVVVVRGRRLMHELVQQQVVFEDSLHRNRQNVPQLNAAAAVFLLARLLTKKRFKRP